MKTQLKTITPKWAKFILDNRNNRNRRLSESFVTKLARDITNGAFITTHQGIAFDESGDLLDGQHRLAAVVMANKPITVPVTTGLASSHRLNGSTINTFELIDGGKPRGVGAMLTMAGYPNGNNVAAAVKTAVLMCAGKSTNMAMSTAQTHKALMYFGKSVSACVTIAKGAKIVRPYSWAVGPTCIYHTVFPESAERFLREAGDVTGEIGSASRALATYFKSHPAVGGQQQVGYIKVAASAIWHHHNGSKISKLYSNDEAAEWLVSLNKELAQKLGALINL